MKREEIQERIEKLGPWFHRIELGEGLVTKTASAVGEPVEHPRPTWEKVRACLPEDVSGKSVLDVGCNAGFYAVELKRRGAGRVVGVDSQRSLVRQAAFVRDVLGLDIEYGRASVYDLDPRELGQFDVVLALGLIYHCKHLVLALERLYGVTRELLILETAVYPPKKAPASFAYDVGGLRPTLHPLAYVENPPEAKEAVYNWFLPGVESLRALLRNVGFDSVRALPRDAHRPRNTRLPQAGAVPRQSLHRIPRRRALDGRGPRALRRGRGHNFQRARGEHGASALAPRRRARDWTRRGSPRRTRFGRARRAPVVVSRGRLPPRGHRARRVGRHRDSHARARSARRVHA